MIMKKYIYLTLLSLFIFSIVSCEPNSISEDENNTELYNVDRTKVKKPGDQGGSNTGG